MRTSRDDLEFAQRAARAALAIASVPAGDHARIIADVVRRVSRDEAKDRRDAAIREAHRLLGYPVLLAAALRDFYARMWPNLCHMDKPPAGAKPIEQAYFRACQACADAGVEMPGERQIRRIIS